MLEQLFLKLALLVTVVAGASDLSFTSGEVCGSSGGWFFGYNDYASFEFQVADWQDTDACAVGGKTDNAGTYCHDCHSSNAAMVMMMRGTTATAPTRLIVTSQVNTGSTDWVNVIGVVAVKALKRSSTNLAVFGIFETEDSNTLVFFRAEEKTDTIDIFTP